MHSAHRLSKKSKSLKRTTTRKSKSLKRTTARKSKSPKRVSKSKSPKRVGSGEKVKFYDLLAKKPFYTKEYKTVTKVVTGKNGKRKVTYFVTTNPTPRKDGSSFENWKILSNTKAVV